MVPIDPQSGLPEPDTAVLSLPTAELDRAEQGRPPARRPGRGGESGRAPHVRLGAIVEGGIAPAILAIVERGVRCRPALASSLAIEVELAMVESYPPVRIVFGERLVLVEDGPGVRPDLRIKGALPDLVSLMVAPLLGGVPSPINARGRAALGMVALRRVRIEGRLGLMRRFLALIRI